MLSQENKVWEAGDEYTEDLRSAVFLCLSEMLIVSVNVVFDAMKVQRYEYVARAT